MRRGLGRDRSPITRERDMQKRKLYEKERLQSALKGPDNTPVEHTDRLTSPIITLIVGKEQRLFAAHEDVLCLSPFFAAAIRGRFHESSAKQIVLPDEIPEVFSCILEYLYKGDYYPRLLHNKRSGTWELEDQSVNDSKSLSAVSTIEDKNYGGPVLRDTVIYCTAEKFALDELKRLALRKQGLVSNVDVSTLLRSARYAYDHTPDSDSKLRAHYLALIIRSRRTFKRSGTMQSEMELGGKLFFDLFVAMCNHMDDIVEITKSPR
jgi:hypothetical protein